MKEEDSRTSNTLSASPTPCRDYTPRPATGYTSAERDTIKHCSQHQWTRHTNTNHRSCNV